MTITARPTTYKGIRMRSRLEAAYAAFLDRPGGMYADRWLYEPRCFADGSGQYLPDFSMSREGADQLYVEVKPEPILTDSKALEAALRRMEIIWSSVPTVTLGLAVGHDAAAGPSFATGLHAEGGGDRLWRISTPSLRLPLIWDRPVA